MKGNLRRGTKKFNIGIWLVNLGLGIFLIEKLWFVVASIIFLLLSILSYLTYPGEKSIDEKEVSHA